MSGIKAVIDLTDSGERCGIRVLPGPRYQGFVGDDESRPFNLVSGAESFLRYSGVDHEVASLIAEDAARLGEDLYED